MHVLLMLCVRSRSMITEKNGIFDQIDTTYTMHYVIRIINYNNNCKYLFAYSRYQQLPIVSVFEDLCKC